MGAGFRAAEQGADAPGLPSGMWGPLGKCNDVSFTLVAVPLGILGCAATLPLYIHRANKLSVEGDLLVIPARRREANEPKTSLFRE